MKDHMMYFVSKFISFGSKSLFGRYWILKFALICRAGSFSQSKDFCAIKFFGTLILHLSNHFYSRNRTDVEIYFKIHFILIFKFVREISIFKVGPVY